MVHRSVNDCNTPNCPKCREEQAAAEAAFLEQFIPIVIVRDSELEDATYEDASFTVDNNGNLLVTMMDDRIITVYATGFWAQASISQAERVQSTDSNTDETTTKD